MKKTISIILSLLITLSAFSAGLVCFLASAEGSDTSENFLLTHPKPTGMDDQTSNPYSEPKGQNFSLSTMNELYYYASYDNEWYNYMFDEMSTATRKTTDNGNTHWLNYVTYKNSHPTGATPAEGANYLKEYRLSYVQSIGFDPLGRGKKDHIAFIGYSNYKNFDKWHYYTYIVVQDLRDGSRQMYVYCYDQSQWTHDQDLPYYLGSAYFAIDAGDFNGDGKDTLVVYCPSDADELKVSEVTFTGSSFSSRTIAKIANLRTGTEDLVTRDNWEFKPTVSFAVGDFDADGRDNLAISTGFGNPGSYSGNSTDGMSKTNTSFEKFVTNVSVMDLDKVSNAWSVKNSSYMYDKGKLYAKDTQSETYNYDVMHMGAITAGDIDNNGYDEIIAVGFTSLNSNHCRAKIWNDTNNMDIYELGNIDKSNYTYSVISYDSKNDVYLRTSLSSLIMNEFEGYNFKDDSNSMWPQIQVETAYTNGQANSAQVFVNGDIYDYKSGGALMKAYTPKIFTQHFTKMMDGSTGADMSFTANVAAGNFDNNSAGREQFVYTVAFKQDGGRDYAIYLGYAGGTVFDDTKDSNNNIVDYGPITYYGCTDTRDKVSSGTSASSRLVHGNNEEATQIFYNKGDHWTKDKDKCINAVICAVDWDDDGLVGRFSRHGYINTDPSPVAVLQESPYFSSLSKAGAYGDEQNNAGTAYEVGYSFEKTTSKGNNVSFGVGLTGELTVGIVKLSAEAGYSLDWNETFEKSVEKEYSKTFTVNQDSVVVSIVPVHVYSYDVYNPQTHSYIPDGYTVTIPANPVYQVMTIDEYNNCVDEYNSYIDRSTSTIKANKLKKINYGNTLSDTTQLPADCQGNPYVYQQWTTQNSNKIDILSDSELRMGYAGAQIDSSYTYSQSTTHSTEMSHGFNFSFSIMFGGGDGVEAWGGGYVNLDYSQTKGNSVSQGKSEGCTGQVVDPSSNENVPYNELTKYGFTWQLAQWYTKLTVNCEDVTPVIGYALKNVISPVGPPRNLEAKYITQDGDLANASIELTWEKPEPIDYGPSVLGYNVYDDGEKINDALVQQGDSDTVVWKINGVEYGAKHHFTVKAVTSGTNALSTPSNEAVLGWVSNAVGIESIVKDDTYQSTDGLTDRYIINFTDKTTSEFYIRNGKDGADGANGATGADGQDGKSAYELAQENGFTGSYEEWLNVIGAKCSENHTYSEYSIAPTCTSDGYCIKVCDLCGYATVEVTNALDHDYSVLSTIEPTCLTSGYSIYQCSNCLDTYIDDITPAKEHEWESKTISNTCLTDGYTINYCTACGCTEYIDETEASGHNYEAVETVDPTCISKGYTVMECSDCGDRIITDITDFEEHDFEINTVEPTCTSEGYTEYYCPSCHYKYIDDIEPAAGHSYVEDVFDPTCTDQGYTRFECEVCHDAFIDFVVPSLGHQYESEEIAPTCTDQGYTKYTCSVCGDVYTDSIIPSLGHDFESEQVDFTCTSPGYTVYTCNECGYSYVADVIPTPGHDIETNTVEPGCATIGYTEYTCSNCDLSYISDITAPTGHNYETEVIEPTCTSAGYTIYTCTECEDTKILDITAASGHTYESAVTESTCSEKGFTTYTCSVCGESYTDDETECKAHTFKDYVTVPTCEDNGFTTHVCTECGFAKVDTEVQAAGHTESDWIATDSNKYIKICTICGKKLDEREAKIFTPEEGEEIPENGSVLNIPLGQTQKFGLGDSYKGAEVTYTSSDPTVVTVDNEGNITTVGAGEATVTAEIEGYDEPVTVTVKVKNLTWLQKLKYILNSTVIFRTIFLLLGIDTSI